MPGRRCPSFPAVLCACVCACVRACVCMRGGGGVQGRVGCWWPVSDISVQKSTVPFTLRRGASEEIGRLACSSAEEQPTSQPAGHSDEKYGACFHIIPVHVDGVFILFYHEKERKIIKLFLSSSAALLPLLFLFLLATPTLCLVGLTLSRSLPLSLSLRRGVETLQVFLRYNAALVAARHRLLSCTAPCPLARAQALWHPPVWVRFGEIFRWNALFGIPSVLWECPQSRQVCFSALRSALHDASLPRREGRLRIASFFSLHASVSSPTDTTEFDRCPEPDAADAVGMTPFCIAARCSSASADSTNPGPPGIRKRHRPLSRHAPDQSAGKQVRGTGAGSYARAFILALSNDLSVRCGSCLVVVLPHLHRADGTEQRRSVLDSLRVATSTSTPSHLL